MFYLILLSQIKVSMYFVVSVLFTSMAHYLSKQFLAEKSVSEVRDRTRCSLVENSLLSIVECVVRQF